MTRPGRQLVEIELDWRIENGAELAPPYSNDCAISFVELHEGESSLAPKDTNPASDVECAEVPYSLIGDHIEPHDSSSGASAMR